MRALSLRAAANCEYALTPRCHCRCRGVLHGAKRLGDAWGETYPPPREAFEHLPAGDPHRLPNAAEREQMRGAANARRRKKRALAKQLKAVTLDVNRWRRWQGGADVPLPQSLTNRLTAIEAELAQL